MARRRMSGRAASSSRARPDLSCSMDVFAALEIGQLPLRRVLRESERTDTVPCRHEVPAKSKEAALNVFGSRKPANPAR